MNNTNTLYPVPVIVRSRCSTANFVDLEEALGYPDRISEFESGQRAGAVLALERRESSAAIRALHFVEVVIEHAHQVTVRKKRMRMSLLSQGVW